MCSLGSILLADACLKVAQASKVLAVAGIIVDAKDDAAIAFYEHFGFTQLQGQANILLLPASLFNSR
jgi:ribosomal protein S18 acetylase RimI-like enzyme